MKTQDREPPAKLSIKPVAGIAATESVAKTGTKTLTVIEGAKRLAAYTAVDQHIHPHHRVCIRRVDDPPIS